MTTQIIFGAPVPLYPGNKQQFSLEPLHKIFVFSAIYVAVISILQLLWFVHYGLY